MINKKYTLKERYLPIDKYKKRIIAQAKKNTEKSKYYPYYHIAPIHGLLNDPNGLHYLNSYHHIYYQWHPVQPTHGLKYWCYIKTKDFHNFHYYGVANSPDTKFDSHGAFSGCAVINNHDTYYFYTGNTRDKNWNRTQYQLVVKNENTSFKNKTMIIDHNHSLFTEHVRDPYVFKHDNNWIMVLGVQEKKNYHGNLAFYVSSDLINWAYLSCLQKPKFLQNLGSMWECPNIVQVNHKLVVIFSAQDLKFIKNEELINENTVLYFIAEKINFETGEANINKKRAQALDYGHDFYAPQIYEFNNKKVMLGWVANLSYEYPDCQDSWTGLLTIPRQIEIKDDKLHQYPLTEWMNSIKSKTSSFIDSRHKIVAHCRLKIFLTEELEIKFYNKKQDFIMIEIKKQEITFIRSSLIDGTRKIINKNYENNFIEIFLDNSVIEIFANNYETTLTSRYFIEDINLISFSQKTKYEYQKIEKNKINYEK